MSWRNQLIQYLKYNSELTDVYEFGVFTGQSILDIINIYKHKQIPIRTIWGFDSFEGLPEEKVEEKWQECWGKGDFNAQSHFGVNSVKKAIEKTQEFIAPNLSGSNLQLISGFYEKSLNKTTFDEYNMGKASYIDIDCDIYSSTVEVLDFIFQNKIAVKGTLIGFDDWGGSVGFEHYKSGQSRAWIESISKYNIFSKKLIQIGNQFPHAHTIWEICSID